MLSHESLIGDTGTRQYKEGEYNRHERMASIWKCQINTALVPKKQNTPCKEQVGSAIWQDLGPCSAIVLEENLKEMGGVVGYASVEFI